MLIPEIISGLKFTVEMFLFDPTTGEKFTEPRNDLDKITIDACNGAINILETIQCIYALKEHYCNDCTYKDCSSCIFKIIEEVRQWELEQLLQ